MPQLGVRTVVVLTIAIAMMLAAMVLAPQLDGRDCYAALHAHHSSEEGRMPLAS